jgi:DNA polymerase-3 subunit beta
MKVNILRDNLFKLIQTVYPVIPTRTTLPILTHILLEAKRNTIQVTGTNLELGITSSLEAEVQEEGAVAVLAKQLHDLLKELPNETLYLQARKNQQLNVEYKKGSFKIMGLPREEYPKLPTTNGQDVVVINQGVLKTMLSMTSFAISKDETRFVLTGTLFKVKDGWLHLVATDGRRLAKIDRQPQQTTAQDIQKIVPEYAVNELTRLLTEESQDVKITFKENQVSFELGNTTLISRLIDGKFPNYEQVIPKEDPNKLSIKRQDFLAATRRVALLSTKDSPSIQMDLKPDHLVISKQTPEMGEAKETVEATFTGKEFSIGFNPDYLMDVLKILPEEDVEFELPGPDKPGVIRTKDHYLYIVLPMQLTNR